MSEITVDFIAALFWDGEEFELFVSDVDYEDMTEGEKLLMIFYHKVTTDPAFVEAMLEVAEELINEKRVTH